MSLVKYTSLNSLHFIEVDRLDFRPLKRVTVDRSSARRNY